MARKSAKSIIPDPGLDKEDLGTFLKWSVGCPSPDPDRRTYPSAGSLYPNHIFIAVKQVAEFDKGLYQYVPDHDAVTRVGEHFDIEAALVQPDVDFNFCVIVAADLNYAVAQYGERGYRFCLLEAGHMVQNMMLVASALDKAVAPIGGFKDDVINQSVFINEKNLKAIYLVPVGKRKDDNA
ncbi:MAG TPA: SagB/ThcOx family dehydrogenase [Bacillales bacterium]|nr:SagB/ThcOx family dehydrogenase [Bacillales bacterium]